jgi:hypothetical protein
MKRYRLPALAVVIWRILENHKDGKEIAVFVMHRLPVEIIDPAKWIRRGLHSLRTKRDKERAASGSAFMSGQSGKSVWKVE